MNSAVRSALIAAIALLASASANAANQPTLLLIGDSMVRNSRKGQVGWGTTFGALFDTAKITVQNRALDGRSGRTFLREGLWDKVLADGRKSSAPNIPAFFDAFYTSKSMLAVVF